jgi:hypothetical protein
MRRSKHQVMDLLTFTSINLQGAHLLECSDDSLHVCDLLIKAYSSATDVGFKLML